METGHSRRWRFDTGKSTDSEVSLDRLEASIESIEGDMVELRRANCNRGLARCLEMSAIAGNNCCAIVSLRLPKEKDVDLTTFLLTAKLKRNQDKRVCS